MSAAQQSSDFHSSFTPLLDRLSEHVQQASSEQNVQNALAALVAARATLQQRDDEGQLTAWDREQYEKRLRELQNGIAAKQTSLDTATSKPRFAFRRPEQGQEAPSVRAAQQQHTTPPAAPSASHTMAQSTPDPSGLQVTLQSNRVITSKDLPQITSSTQGISLSISHIDSCIVDLRGSTAQLIAVSATNVKTSALLLPVVDGSVMLTGLEDTSVVLGGSRQIRLSSSKRTSLALLTTSSPVTLEACESLKVSRGAEVQDFDQPGAGPSKKETSSWSVLLGSQQSNLLDFAKSVAAQVNGSASTSSAELLTALAQVNKPPTPSTMYLPEDSGILLVFSDPGQTSTLEEFHDWYDTEHVPLRTQGFVEFRSAARYSSQTIESPLSPSTAPAAPAPTSTPKSKAFEAGWGAAYTISTNDLYVNTAYSGLRSNRSPREADLVARLGVLDRRIYKLVADSNALALPRGDVTPFTKADTESKASVVECVSFNMSSTADGANGGGGDAEVRTWFESILPSLRQRNGFTRSRLIKLIDALVNGTEVTPSNGDAKAVPQWMVFTELSSAQDQGQGQASATLSLLPASADKDKVEVRVMELYRAWDPVRALEDEGR